MTKRHLAELLKAFWRGFVMGLRNPFGIRKSFRTDAMAAAERTQQEEILKDLERQLYDLQVGLNLMNGTPSEREEAKRTLDALLGKRDEFRGKFTRSAAPNRLRFSEHL